MSKYTDQDIDDFIQNEMDLETHQQFCEVLKENVELREKVALRQLVVNAERSLAERDIRRIMERKPRRCSMKRFYYTGMLVAAALVGIIFIVGYSPKYTTSEIFEACYVAPEIERSRGANASTATLLYESVRHIEAHQPEKAIDILRLLDDPDYIEEIQWLLLCSYLEAGDKEQALSLVDQIIDSNTFYAEQAKEIRSRLKQRRWF